MKRFTIRWDKNWDSLGSYRVSIPELTGPIEVVDAESYDRLRAALEQIAGHFVPGQQKTYASPDRTLDMIRHEAERALLD